MKNMTMIILGMTRQICELGVAQDLYILVNPVNPVNKKNPLDPEGVLRVTSSLDSKLKNEINSISKINYGCYC